MGLAARAWESDAREQAELTLLFEPFPPARFGMSCGAIETAKRAVEFWAALGGPAVPAGSSSDQSSPTSPKVPGSGLSGVSLALEQPWDWTHARRAQLMPRPELADAETH